MSRNRNATALVRRFCALSVLVASMQAPLHAQQPPRQATDLGPAAASTYETRLLRALFQNEAILTTSVASPPGLIRDDESRVPYSASRAESNSYFSSRTAEPAPSYSPINPCSHWNRNRSDEPLSRRTNCHALGIPSD